MKLDHSRQRLLLKKKLYISYIYAFKVYCKSGTLSHLSQVSALLVWSAPSSQSSGVNSWCNQRHLCLIFGREFFMSVLISQIVRTYSLKHSATHNPQVENGVLRPCFNSRVQLWLWWFLIRFSQLYMMLFWQLWTNWTGHSWFSTSVPAEYTLLIRINYCNTSVTKERFHSSSPDKAAWLAGLALAMPEPCVLLFFHMKGV